MAEGKYRRRDCRRRGSSLGLMSDQTWEAPGITEVEIDCVAMMLLIKVERRFLGVIREMLVKLVCAPGRDTYRLFLRRES